MSQDIVSDALNGLMNAKKAGHEEICLKRYSKFLLSVLEIAKSNNYVEDFNLDLNKKELKIKLGKLNSCNSIKPRFNVSVEEIEKYVRRYLPSRNFGILLVSTSSGLMTHHDAYEKKLGGSLIAFFY